MPVQPACRRGRSDPRSAVAAKIRKSSGGKAAVITDPASDDGPRLGAGTRVAVKADGLPAQWRRVHTDSSYLSASERLGVTINTVRDHVRAIYEKLHVHSRSEAVSKGLRRRFIE